VPRGHGEIGLLSAFISISILTVWGDECVVFSAQVYCKLLSVLRCLYFVVEGPILDGPAMVSCH
jgi:hypothetical protein